MLERKNKGCNFGKNINIHFTLNNKVKYYCVINMCNHRVNCKALLHSEQTYCFPRKEKHKHKLGCEEMFA